MLSVTLLMVCLSASLYIVHTERLFPQQDTGQIGGAVQGAQDVSFDAMDKNNASS